GWFFNDDDNNHSFLFPDSLVIDPGDYLVVVNDILGFHEIYPEITTYCGQFDFGLGSGGDEVRLFDDFGQQTVYIAYESGEPWPSNVIGTGRTLELIDYGGALNNPINWKSGCFGGSPDAPSSFCHDTSRIIVTEFNYQSSAELDAGDWVEIYNHDTVVVDLRGWGFKDESAYHYYAFPSSVTMLPGEYLLIVQDTVKFKNIYPDIASFVGPFDFGLSMNGDMIMLSDPFGQQIVKIDYEGGYPWPDQANGTGRSVELIDYDVELNNYANWKNGCVGGSPGTDFIPCDTNSIQYLTTDISFISYPNPFSGSILIELELRSEKFIQINLIDQYGRNVFRLHNGMMIQGKNKLHFETGELSSGIYYLQVIVGEKVIYRKVVKF
ncbi:MAG: lamin tail domain-containing protein, partial [Bacteroidales bacterium]|nr:lamin tail domain-containing protein [Bacteroidales bacterium]